jgi:diadenylate cyclase
MQQLLTYFGLNFSADHLSLLLRLIDILDILVVSWVIYRTLLVVRGTRAMPMLWGLALVVVVYLIARFIGLNTLAWILGNFLSSIVLVVVVVFQDEIRRALTKVGLTRVFFGNSKPILDRSIEDLVLVAQRLSADRLGALIVIQGKIGLDEIVEDGVKLDALLSRKLILSIFNKASPLHDGAVVVEAGRIKAAGCVLPLSINPELDPNLGTRHRAAVGVSEKSDAIVIVVSEQSGEISFVKEGKLAKGVDVSRLRDMLMTSSFRERGAEHE